MSKKNIVAGILAHVDAGKTTLSEAMLYEMGNIRKLGRVDHKDAFLDTYDLEKQRGITIFSKQALLKMDDANVYLLDTPGHVDFSTEMERTLDVLDYAILVIDGSSELKNHTFTVWRLLRKKEIPTFIFVNKMDMSDKSHEDIIGNLQSELHGLFVDFTDKDETFFENISMSDESLMERYLEGEFANDEEIGKVIANNMVFPCFFGSALKLDGVKDFANIFALYAQQKEPKSVTSGKIFKVSRDENGARLTHIRITGGELKTKQVIEINGESEKINQIRIYSGAKYENIDTATSGMTICVTGLNSGVAGDVFGDEKRMGELVTAPVLNYTVVLPKDADAVKVYNTIKILDEEDPSLSINWNEVHKVIEIKLMGEIQTEVLKSIVKERFDIDIDFGMARIIYKETIDGSVTGVGHFEPLRHYAEVHLRITGMNTGNGVTSGSKISVDRLDKNWQRLIDTHIHERRHRGVLTGSELTDVHIDIVAGKAHKKHTEGGDFRQATYRAIRQGLMKASSVLLEPYYRFVLEIPRDMTGRAMMDLENMSAKFESPDIGEKIALIKGLCPVSEMMSYALTLSSYTKGLGRLSLTVDGYYPCHNSEEVIEKIGYDPLRDIRNTPDSVFCAGGSGYTVAYDRVEEFMHVHEEDDASFDEINFENMSVEELDRIRMSNGGDDSAVNTYGNELDKKKFDEYKMLDKELTEIFERTYGPVKFVNHNKQESIFENTVRKGPVGGDEKYAKKKQENIERQKEKKMQEYLLVDGYNVIFAWEDLSELAAVNIDAARDRLMDMLCNYQGLKKCKLMLVFDAYKVKGNTGSAIKYHNITVVYTKEAETADAYIEKFAHDNAGKYKITVATSDGLEQIIIRGEGCLLMSSRELRIEMAYALKEAKDQFEENKSKDKTYLFDNLDEDFRNYLMNMSN